MKYNKWNKPGYHKFKIAIVIIVVLVSGLIYIAIGFKSSTTQSVEAPYPPSPVIKGVDFHFSTHVRLAPGSDLWPVTWGSDDNLYLAWGDGGGFGGTNQTGRVSLGYARIKGTPDKFTALNVWGGNNTENTATFGGKSAGIISVDEVLYSWVTDNDGGGPSAMRLHWSNNQGASWQKAPWAFTESELFQAHAFLNYGRDNEGAPDNYVYIYGKHQGVISYLYLARVLKHKLKFKQAYEFYAGLDKQGNPKWVTDVENYQPVATDSAGIGAVAAVYNPGIGRYLLTSHHGNYVGRWALFDAANPWGPWTTIGYYDDWNGMGNVRAGMPHSFPSKWISGDGTTMYMIFSGKGEWDSFNLIKVVLTLRKTKLLEGD